MTSYREIRADYNRESIVVYQAYNDQIADRALEAGRFVTPFSFQRMTWIKPSFLWLMERSGWGTKPNQTRTLAVRISRNGWEAALNQGVLTAFEPGIHESVEHWRSQFKRATVHVQWDPERSLRGKKLEHRAIQVGIGRTVIAEFVSEWIQEISDLTELVNKLRRLRREGRYNQAKDLLPKEAVYPLAGPAAKNLGLTDTKRSR